MYHQQTLYDYWLALYSRKKFILAVSFSSTLFAVLISMALPSVYEAKASFYLPINLEAPSYTSELGQHRLAQKPLRPAGDTKQLGFHIGILKSNDTVEKLHIAYPDKPKKFFKKNIDIVAGSEQSINVYVRDRDPVLAAEIANLYVDIFESFNQNAITRNATRTYEVLKKELGELDKLIQENVAEKSAFLEEHNIISSGHEQSLLAEQANEIESQLNMTTVDINATREKVRALNQKLSEEQEMYDVHESVTTSPQIEKLTARVQEFEIELSKIPPSKQNNNNWQYASKKAQLRKTRALLDVELSNLITGKSKQPNSIYETLRKSLIQEASQKKYLEAREYALKKTLREINIRIHNSVPMINTLETLNDEQAILKDLRSSVKKNLAEAYLQKEYPKVDVVQTETAIAPENPAFPNPFLNGLVALLLGFAAGCYYALFLHYLNNLGKLRIRRNLDDSLLEEVSS